MRMFIDYRHLFIYELMLPCFLGLSVLESYEMVPLGWRGSRLQGPCRTSPWQGCCSIAHLSSMRK